MRGLCWGNGSAFLLVAFGLSVSVEVPPWCVSFTLLNGDKIQESCTMKWNFRNTMARKSDHSPAEYG
eukprot:6047288-Amphidinium_carterae.1